VTTFQEETELRLLLAPLLHVEPVRRRPPRRAAIVLRSLRRTPILVALAAAVAVPAVAFASQLGGLLGISNEGTGVPTSSVLAGDSTLDQALQHMNAGGTMQSLGTLNGITFYATRNSAGDFCVAFDRTADNIGKGVVCDLNADNFPSANVKVIGFPSTLLGVAADGVTTVALLDAAGNVIKSTPVVNNLFAATVTAGQQPLDAAYVETLDSSGDVLTKEKLDPQSRR